MALERTLDACALHYQSVLVCTGMYWCLWAVVSVQVKLSERDEEEEDEGGRRHLLVSDLPTFTI